MAGPANIARPPPHAAPVGPKRRTTGGFLHRDEKLHVVLRIRLDDAMRGGDDPTLAAIQAIREHEEGRSNVAHRLLTETVDVAIIPGAENAYKIRLRREDAQEATIELTQKTLHREPHIFAERYLQYFHDRIKMREDDWDILTAAWLDRARVLDEREELTSELATYESLIERLQQCHICEDLHACLRNEEWLLWETGATPDAAHVLVPSDKLARFLKAAPGGEAIKIERLATLLRDHNVVDGGSFVKKVDGKPKRFWRFRAGPLGFTDARLELPPDAEVPPMPVAATRQELAESAGPAPDFEDDT